MLLYVENKKNLVDKKIGIEIGLSDATIVIWTASFCMQFIISSMTHKQLFQ